jgi:hypothetical protein
VVVRKNKGGVMMGEVIVILGLALYIPMSMVFVFSEKN